jgi:hypothetical protein
MAVIRIDGKDRHLGKDVLAHIEAHYAERELGVNPTLASGMVLYGLLVVAEAMKQPGGLFGEHLVELPVADLPKSPKSRELLRVQIIAHLKDAGFPRPALDIRHCPVEKALVLHGTFRDKLVPLSFLGPTTLVAASAGALRELDKPAKDRLPVFRGSDPTHAISAWRQLHERHLQLKAEHLARGRKPAPRKAAATA